MEDNGEGMRIINFVLGEKGILKYNAVKNRFMVEDAEKKTALLHMHKENIAEAPDNTIQNYRTNLQKLRKKIEERRVRITEIATPNTGQSTREVVQTETTKTEESIVQISPNGTRTPIVLCTPAPTQHITTISTIEQFKNSNVFGSISTKHNRKRREGGIRLERTELTTSITTKKGDTEVISKIDLLTSRLFIVVKERKRVFFCFEKPARYISLDKEIDIVNIAQGKHHEIILKNTNTGAFLRESLRTLEFCVKDARNTTHMFETENSNEFIRWILLLKMRMQPVDLWNRSELLESMEQR